jgi:hypothetical protein
MVTAGEDADSAAFINYLVNEPVFLVYAARPATGELMLERLGLSRSFEWSALDFANESKDAKRHLTVGFHPPGKVFEGG